VSNDRRSSAQTEDNVTLVNDLILSQEDKPRSHKTVQAEAHNSSIFCCMQSWTMCHKAN